MWQLSDMRVVVQWWSHQDRRLIQDLVRKVWESLRMDQKRCVETAGLEVEALLMSDPPLVKET